MTEQRSAAVAVLSAVIGWSYFLCWVATFWPQPLLNYRRKRVSGLSLEFVCYQFTGFLCYSIYSIVSYMLQSTHSSDPDVSVAVRPNDIAFAVHALLLTTVVCVQYWLYTTSGSGDSTGRVVVSAVHRYILFALWVVVAFSLLLALTGSIPYDCIHQSTACPLYHINLLSLLGYIKIAVNLVKNIPQLLLNHTNRSTLGWSIEGVLLDIVGSLLAFTQQGLDAWNSSDAGMVWGNVPKLLLSVLSFVFDGVFLLQHFVWYRSSSRSGGSSSSGGSSVVDGEKETGLLGEVDEEVVDDDDSGEEEEGEFGQQVAARSVAEDDEKSGSGDTDSNYHIMQDGAINAAHLPT